jgi:uncharacterized iron-regulated membrane protein
VSGGEWRDRNRRNVWPAPPARRGQHPALRASVRLLVLVLALAAIAAGGGTAVWLLEDDQGRDEIQRSLHDMPLVGRVVSDPDAP